MFTLLADATRVRIVLALRDADEPSVNHLADIVSADLTSTEADA